MRRDVLTMVGFVYPGPAGSIAASENREMYIIAKNILDVFFEFYQCISALWDQENTFR